MDRVANLIINPQLSVHCPLTTNHLKYFTADSNSFISYSPGTFL